ncbi:hypothetical protein PTSG_05006 [Salpingoeca rosetta]|uniref:N-alpha-acetyltransferase 60 n=1 Tax=Salpingoeca rosetta (strain ATCC 50818 / BSB-021) TaxID=946362 RepID=F2U987_SALR5|nr:uncharacterized protein PTSG_05006 [Salpingoeca rosetta]EGD73290.1 hypothetical protein PTSG_05006 [Salpingoeca rosetta]|eukprot:XP_004994321.1 hypothetical protein PTSG_05006 [Salpingoeca rosetta]
MVGKGDTVTVSLLGNARVYEGVDARGGGVAMTNTDNNTTTTTTTQPPQVSMSGRHKDSRGSTGGLSQCHTPMRTATGTAPLLSGGTGISSHDMARTNSSSAQPALSMASATVRIATTFLPALDTAHICYRRLESGDRAQLKALHDVLFPISYPDRFFDSAVIPYSELDAFGAFSHDGTLLGFIVFKITPASTVDIEDQGVVHDPEQKYSLVYILTLGVIPRFQSHGIGSALLELLLACNVVSKRSCKAVLLHVLASNTRAVAFYQRHGFRRYRILEDYYHINGVPAAALSCVRYIHGGRPTSVFDPIFLMLDGVWQWICTRTTQALVAASRLLT